MITLAPGRSGNAYALDVTFEDERGRPTTPLSACWSLYNSDEEAIRLDVDITSLAPKVEFLIPATDIGSDSNCSDNERLVLITAKYLSSISEQVETMRQWAKFTFSSPGKLT